MDVILLAAGFSRRFGDSLPKPFVKIAGKPLIFYPLFTLQRSKLIDRILVVISPEAEGMFSAVRNKYLKKITKITAVVHGGKERQDSVFNGLNFLSASGHGDIVAIHDAARPFLKEELLETLNLAARETGGAAPGIKVVDTIKSVDGNSIVAGHLKRDELRAIQTPQVFVFDKLFDAYKGSIGSGVNFTDDNEIFGVAGWNVKVVGGDSDLFKVTFKEDMIKARHVLAKMRSYYK